MEQPTYWRKCSTCRKEISFDSHYEVCSVSTCRKLAFCSQDCFGVHVPHMRHRDAYPEDGHSPTLAAYMQSEGEAERAATRRIVPTASGPDAVAESLPRDILIVASKLKDYVRARSGLNTSQGVIDRLSDIVRRHVDEAVQRAMADGRKTLMDRDF